MIPHALHRLADRAVRGTPIWSYEWDVCCVLDGCRVDTFRTFRPDADAYWSVGSMSKTWLRQTFDDRDTGRVAYIGGNPFAPDLLDREAFAYVHVEPVREVEGVETVPPRALLDRAVTVWRRRDELGVDRLVIHYMQPHVPFRTRPNWFSRFRGSEVWGSSRWEALRDGAIDREEWLDAYADNLSWVLSEGVEPLADLVDATVGVTSDHGNAAGEWGVYGHPRGVVVPEVRKVPWWSFEAAAVTDNYEAVDLTTDTISERDVAAQLEALGYHER